MNRQVPHIQPEDFTRAMQELGTYVDVSTDDLMQLHRAAEKYARLRNTESLGVEKLMTHPVKTVHASCSLSDAAHMLITQRISGLPVVDDRRRLTGIITEADFLRALGVPSHHPGHNLWQTLEHMFSQPVQLREPEGQVADLMVSDVITITAQQSLHQALDVMKQHRIKRLVVCDEARHVQGIITRSDLVRVFFDHFNPGRQDNKGETS